MWINLLRGLELHQGLEVLMLTACYQAERTIPCRQGRLPIIVSEPSECIFGLAADCPSY